MKEIEEFSC